MEEINFTNEIWDVYAMERYIAVPPDALTNGIFEGRFDGTPYEPPEKEIEHEYADSY